MCKMGATIGLNMLISYTRPISLYSYVIDNVRFKNDGKNCVLLQKL